MGVPDREVLGEPVRSGKSYRPEGVSVLIRTYSGEIVHSQTQLVGTSDMRDGFITILTEDCEYVRLDVGTFTSFETLEEGESVIVVAETLGSTGKWIAKTVVRSEVNEFPTSDE